MVEQVVLLAEDGARLGTSPKHAVHSAHTPLHLAFSCHVFRADGSMLVTRRAIVKRTWPGVWTNSFCGHPGPDETIAEAVHRRAVEELGASVRDVELVVPDFRYRAVDASGIVENEICPVHTATLEGELSPDPTEISQWEWVRPDDLAEAVARAPFAFSPWLAQQLPLLGIGTGR